MGHLSAALPCFLPLCARFALLCTALVPMFCPALRHSHSPDLMTTQNGQAADTAQGTPGIGRIYSGIEYKGQTTTHETMGHQ